MTTDKNITFKISGIEIKVANENDIKKFVKEDHIILLGKCSTTISDYVDYIKNKFGGFKNKKPNVFMVTGKQLNNLIGEDKFDEIMQSSVLPLKQFNEPELVLNAGLPNLLSGGLRGYIKTDEQEEPKRKDNILLVSELI